MSRLWAITSYFNPSRYARRRLAYRNFRQSLELPLLVVEHGHQDQLDLTEGDAEILRQVAGGDSMWQKERLLNIALESLPPECDQVAWLDCDILFSDYDWVRDLDVRLESARLVQLFTTVNYLGRGWAPGKALERFVERRRPSIASGVCTSLPASVALPHPSPAERPGTYVNGFAWAATREFISRHGFFDACIVGGGDRAIICAAYGCYSHIFEWHRMNEAQRSYYREWAEPFYKDCQGAVAAMEGDIYHQWHGDASDRGLSLRHVGLRPFDFNPYSDIAVDRSGCWRWNTDKPELHRYVRDYFSSRKEDG